MNHSVSKQSTKTRTLAFLITSVLMTVTLADREADLVILDDISVQNLGIETEVVTSRDFEETLFALGRIQAKPGGHAYVTSRIAGRLVDVPAHEGDFIKAGDPVAIVESRQPGNPPPRLTLHAPISGLVVKSLQHLGEPVVPEVPILEIVDLSEAYAVAKIPEDKVSWIKSDTPSEIKVAAYPDQIMNGTWERFGTMADASNATLDAYFRIQDPGQNIRPNMRTEFTLHINTKKGVMAVPKDALQGDSFQPFVFVKDFELPNAFLKASVVTGIRNDSHVEILKGLFPGDQVVTKGAYPLAFAGSGGISLKEALDAAHGHEHNEDGSEMTAAQKATRAAENNQRSGASGSGPFTWFLMALCVIQWLLLALLGGKQKAVKK
jgi:cobalt-zinc-cadmium efflux system membrane fusion protein